MSDREAIATTKANSIEEDKHAAGNEEDNHIAGNEEDNQVEGSSRDKLNGSAECDKSFGTRKRCRDETNELLYEGEVDLEGDGMTNN